jgi:DNA gyrase subunit A
MDVIGEEGELLTMSENGFAKRTNIKEFRVQGRGGKGIIVMKLNAKTGTLVGIKVVQVEDQLMVITNNGIMLRIQVSSISNQGRSAQGVLAMRTGASTVVAMAKVLMKDEEEIEGSEDSEDLENSEDDD